MYLFFKDIAAKDIIVRHEIQRHGGAFKMMERLKMGGVGLGGLRYIEGVPEIEKIRNIEDTIVANFEMMREAFVIRFRNVEFHSMVLCHFSAIKSVHLNKKADILNLQGNSLMKSLMKRGTAYETARMFATPRQLIRLGKIKLTIGIGDETFVFENQEGFTTKISAYFQHSIFEGIYTEDITAYEVLNMKKK